MTVSEELQRVATEFKEPIEKVQEIYDSALNDKKMMFPKASVTEQEAMAFDATLASFQRKTQGTVRIFDGIFLAYDGRVNDWARRDFDETMRIVTTAGADEARKQGILNSKGQPIYRPDKKFNAGQIINRDDVFFDLQGVLFDPKNPNVPINMVLRVYKLDLQSDVILNKLVRFYAAIDARQKGKQIMLRSERETQFEYFDTLPSMANMALNASKTRFISYPVKDIFKFAIVKKDANNQETIEYDRHYWRFDDLVVAEVHKNRGNRTFIEFAHPELMGWTIYALFEQVPNEYALVRDYKASIFAQVREIDHERKMIHVGASGYWQSAEVRPKGPQKMVDPAAVKMTFKL